MITKITAFFTAIVIFFGNFALIGEPDIPEACSEEELLQVESIVNKVEISDDIYVIEANSFSYDEKLVLTCLQGIVAKTNPCIYLKTCWADSDYLKYLKNSGKTLHYDNDGTPWTFKNIITKFKSYIGDNGYTVYSQSYLGEGLNAATNYATAYGWLPILDTLEQTAVDCGLVKKKDLTSSSYDVDFQKKVWNELKDFFNTDAVVHEKYSMPGLRDLAIQQGYYTFFTDIDNAGKKYYKEILTWTGPNTSVEGWVEEEKECVAITSEMGCWLHPSDICNNNSILASFEDTTTIVKENEAKAYTDPTKHYVALVFTDGDNVQWIQNGFGEYHTVVKDYTYVNMAWTVSPFLKEFSPLAYKRTYDIKTSNSELIAGPSGYGYCNPAVYKKGELDDFSKITASAMLKSGMNIITILDDYTKLKDKKFAYRLGYFSRFENIDGGVLFLDPDGYRGGKGKIWFSNDKPFLSNRMVLWGDDGYNSVNDEWLKRNAEIINNYPIDINSINGYSLICVHAWSMKPEKIQQFIELLDEDVEIVTVSDLLKTIETNIPHKDAAPDECYK